MSTSHLSFTKICKSCGQQKPLSDFQQIKEGLRTTYGNICSSCRKVKKEHDNTTSTTGKKIDAKAKVQGEADKREVNKQVKENYYKDRDKKGERVIQQTERAAFAEQTEKKIRSFLETRAPYKKSYTSDNKPTVTSEVQKETVKFDLEKEIVEYDRHPQIKTMLAEPYKRFKTWLKGSPTPPLVKSADKAVNQNPSEKPELDPLNQFIKKRF